jgi:hypothetical protein
MTPIRTLANQINGLPDLPAYAGYLAANIRTLANQINGLPSYAGRRADELIRECDSADTTDGLMLYGAAIELLAELSSAGLGNHVYALELAQQIAPTR